MNRLPVTRIVRALAVGALVVAATQGCSRKQEPSLARAEPGAPATQSGEQAERPAARERSATDASAPVGTAEAARMPTTADVAVTAVAEEPAGAAVVASSVGDLPLAPMGRPRGRSILEGQPGYQPLDDPEADSVERGRRLVGPIEGELADTWNSPEALAQAVLDAVQAADSKALHALRITEAEFGTFFWPEFPASRPATSMTAHDAWVFHNADCHDGVSEMLTTYGGRDLVLDGVKFTVGVAPYTNFKLYHGAQIHARTERGEPVVLPYATVFAERHGRWKIYILED